METQRRPDATMVISPLPSFARAGSGRSSTPILEEEDASKPPGTIRVSLTVTAGPGQGKVHKLNKPRVVIGREGADIVLEDPEISRHHCILEVRDDRVSLRDLDSTNGTFFEEERVRAALLQDGAEFRIGETRLRLNIQPR